MIKNYTVFVNEIYNVYQKDTPEMSSDKSHVNQVELFIKEFNAKKKTIDNIYVTYKDEKDLINKLYAQKFIPSNTNDRKKIKFINPLIGLYAESAKKKRELKSLEDDLKAQQDTLNDRNSQISGNPDLRNTLQDDINYSNERINSIKQDINRVKTEILALEKNTAFKLKEMKDDLVKDKNRINYFVRTK